MSCKASPVFGVRQDIEQMTLWHPTRDGSPQHFGGFWNRTSTDTLQNRYAVIIDGNCSVILWIALIHSLGCFCELFPQAFSEIFGRTRQADFRAVFVQDDLALRPRERLTAIIGEGLRPGQAEVS